MHAVVQREAYRFIRTREESDLSHAVQANILSSPPSQERPLDSPHLTISAHWHDVVVF